MTIISTAQTHTSNSAPARVVWSEADADLWVADADGVFGGSVDSASGRHVARDLFGRERGTFDTLAAACRCIEAFLAHPAMTRRLAGMRSHAQ